MKGLLSNLAHTPGGEMKGLLSNLVHTPEGLLSHKVKSSELAPGDHIYAYRSGYAYSHHGIFVRENTVIHYMQKDEGSSSSTTIPGLISSFSSSTTLAAASEKISKSTCSKLPNCGLRHPGNGVALSCLDCFLGDKKLRRYQYGATQGEFKVKLRGGTSTTAKSDPPEEVIRRARYLLEVGFGNYNLGNHNCEDFALYCKTGLLIPKEEAFGASGQINSVQAAFSSVGDHSSVIEYTRTYNTTRYSSDIGVRTDVVKVPVEDVASFLNRREGHNLEYPSLVLQEGEVQVQACASNHVAKLEIILLTHGSIGLESTIPPLLEQGVASKNSLFLLYVFKVQVQLTPDQHKQLLQGFYVAPRLSPSLLHRRQTS